MLSVPGQSPTWGVMFATYLGYWLMGVMLIAVGMVASLLSSNVTVAFILGVLFCCGPSVPGLAGLSPSAGSVRRHIEDWSIPAQFHDFGTGVISLSGVVLLHLAGRGDALPEHGAPGPAALGRRRGQPGPLDALGRSGSASVLVALFSLNADDRAARGCGPTASAEQLAHALGRVDRD